jgi:hypothetical protein
LTLMLTIPASLRQGEAMTFKAKPARKIVRARPVKAAKDAV